MTYRAPPKNKSAVNRAGNAIANQIESPDDLATLDLWRVSHAYVLNTFKVWILNKIQKSNVNIEFAQRLKRRNTVIDKLRRFDKNGTPLIKDVTSMHDFAGCRLIFNSIEDLQRFRSYMHSREVTKNVQHSLKNEIDKYDYVAAPKFTGYRGIHDVYRHFPRGSERADKKKPWDGLMVEIQYRTRAQHAWATAVEISDVIDGQRTKFEMDQSERGRFFAISSELIARNIEGITNGLQEFSSADLIQELNNLEEKLGILGNLSLLKQFEVKGNFKRHNVLNIYKNISEELNLELYPYDSPTDAIAKANELEQSSESINAVYVRGDNPSQIRSAYRNYFNDPVDFVSLVNKSIVSD